MSSTARDMVEGHEEVARSIQAFMWEGKPHKSQKIERTVEEYEAFLEGIREESWQRYNSGAYDLGWKK